MPDPPQNAKDIFFAAIEIEEAAQRAAFLDRSCEGNDGLRQRVEDLLRAYGQSGGPLEKLAAALAPTDIGQPISEQVGTVIGPYKLMEQIGEGGFGLVFVAEQQRPLRRKVALKIIKPGMDTRDVIGRFEAERQALALMDHPNIARVLDAGTTDSGRPYFVMELVRGIPITDYCDQAQLTPRERLELFISVCNAVQHAHQKGIIHRDIKPSNVMVTLHDDRPVVKVIDFGVAKALHQSLTDRTVYTRFAQMIGTPLYMSPEQARMNSLDIDTRSDIYSLGVLLYELLTGSTPFDKQRLAKAAYEELLKIIRDEEPPKPSLRLSKSTASLPSIAALRNTEPAKLSKMFHGDLDWITMKALEKDRIRRYETANSFAADVSRYLNDEPVEASPPSASYRLRKFARKHRRPVIALATLMAVLLLGIAGTTWGLFRAKTAEQAAGESEHKAVAALGQVANERDAKQTALLAASAERDQAELHLASGLLRPIGFSEEANQGELSQAELRSFVDWSAVKDSRLKMRVLEIAFEDPKTALRVAKRAERAERVIQSCVGLSPIRHAQAVQLVSTKQRDSAADPRIRIAACWLALELGSADLPAWAESCTYLSDPKNDLGEFIEFVDFAAKRSEPQQISHLNADPLIAILERSTDAAVVVAERLGAWAPRLTRVQVTHVWDALVAISEKPDDHRDKISARVGLIALAPSLEPAQVTRAFDGLVAILEKHKDNGVRAAACDGLGALATHLEPAQVKHSAGVLIAILEKYKYKDDSVLDAACRGLVALVPRLEPAQATRAWDSLIAILENHRNGSVRYEACPGLVRLAPRLEQAQVKRASDVLIAILEDYRDANVLDAACRGLVALAPRLEPAQVMRACDGLVAILEKSKTGAVLNTAGDGLRALATHLEPAQVKRAWNILLAFLDSGWNFLNDLVALAPRLQSADVNVTWEALITPLEKSKDRTILWHASERLIAIAPRLEPDRTIRAWDALIQILKSSKDEFVQHRASEALAVLARRMESAEVALESNRLIEALGQPTGSNDLEAALTELTALESRLEPTQANRVAETVIAILERSKDDAGYMLRVGFVALTPRLKPAQAARAMKVLITILEKPNDRGSRGNAYGMLCNLLLVPLPESASRENLSMTAMKALLDNCSAFPDGAELDGDELDAMVAKSVSSARTLANLLSHPACVAELRECFLQRFEELVFYDGKRVFLKEENPDGKQPAHDQTPPRRFHNLRDAAVWIQQNWPDFDLETNCPVTWCGSL